MTALRALVLICHGGIPPRSECEGLPSPSPRPSKSGAADLSRKAVRLRDVKKRAAFFYRVMRTGTKRCYPCGRATGERRAAPGRPGLSSAVGVSDEMHAFQELVPRLGEGIRHRVGARLAEGGALAL